MKLPKKRDDEWREFENLGAGYSDQDIAAAVEYLQTHGTLHGHEPCHSPMADLGRAMNEVISVVRETQAKSAEKGAQARAQAEQERLESERRVREDVEWQVREAAFLRAFPTEEKQREVIAEFNRESPWKQQGAVARSYAIQQWWKREGGLAVEMKVSK